MANGMSLDWPLDRAMGLIRTAANAIAPDTFDPDTIADIIHTKVLQVAEMLGEAGTEEFTKTQALTITAKAATISTYRIDEILAIRSATSGEEVKMMSAKNFELDRNKAQITGGSKSIICTRHGASLAFDHGSAITFSSATMIYKAIPEKKTMAAPTETLDIPDKYIPLVLELAEIRLYEIINQAPPDSLSARAEAKTDKIRAAGQTEKARISGSIK